MGNCFFFPLLCVVSIYSSQKNSLLYVGIAPTSGGPHFHLLSGQFSLSVTQDTTSPCDVIMAVEVIVNTQDSLSKVIEGGRLGKVIKEHI